MTERSGVTDSSSPGRRLGLFGGSFDPIHSGHVDPILEAKQQLELDRVLFLPTASPPHKLGRRLAPAWQRYSMVELALLRCRELQVDPHELTATGPSYTIETLEAFAAREPGTDLYLLVGEDSLRALPTWRRGTEIPGLATVAVLRRPGGPDDPVPSELRPAFERGRIVLLETRPNPSSSTALRRQLSRWARTTPRPGFEGLDPLVLDYIRKYELYLEHD